MAPNTDLPDSEQEDYQSSVAPAHQNAKLQARECCSPGVKAKKRGHSDKFGAKPPQR